MAEEINLLKSEEKKGLGSLVPKTNLPFYVTVGVLALALLLWGGLEWHGARIDDRVSMIQQEAVAVKLETEDIEADRKEAVSFQGRLSNLKTLLDQHLVWSALLDELESVTLTNARLSTLEAGETETTLIITGVVTDYADLGKLMLGLEASPHFQNVVLKSSDRSQDETAGYLFNMEIPFSSELLRE